MRSVTWSTSLPSDEYYSQIRKLNFAKYANAMKDGNNDIVSLVVKNSFADQGFAGSNCSQTT